MGGTLEAEQGTVAAPPADVTATLGTPMCYRVISNYAFGLIGYRSQKSLPFENITTFLIAVVYIAPLCMNSLFHEYIQARVLASFFSSLIIEMLRQQDFPVYGLSHI